MATQLPRPGVEVIQEFRSASPTIVRPTLVPFVCGPAKEIVEVTNADGTLNEDAKQGLYDQLPLTISQSAFPSPRGNIAEVNVEEGTIRTFFQFGGSLVEHDRDPGSSFLVSHNYARRAAVLTKPDAGGAGFDLNEKVLVLAFNVTAVLNTTEDIIITFAETAPAVNLTAQQVADQINNAVGATVASLVTLPGESDERVQIASRLFGATSSVTVRNGGSANTVLGFVTDNLEFRVEGSGFRAQDQNDNTTLSAFVQWFRGAYYENAVAATFPAVPGGAAAYGLLDADGVFYNSAAPDVTFAGAGSIDLRVGDEFYADGVRPNNAFVMKVEATRFKLGTLNTQLSTFDESGKVISAVYNQHKVNTLFAGVPFAPRYGWFKAKTLPTSNFAIATAASLTGSVSGKPAELASIKSSAALVFGSVALAGLNLKVVVTVDDVEQEEQTFVFTGGPYTTMASIVSAIGTNIEGVLAIEGSGADADKLILSTVKTGDNQAIRLKANSTANSALNFSTVTDTVDVGADVEFRDNPATLQSGSMTFPLTLGGPGETIIIKKYTDGGVVFTTHTFTFGATSFANIAALVAELQTAQWDGSLPASAGLAIEASGNAIIIKTINGGSAYVLQVDGGTALGAVPNADILYTVGHTDVGEENLAGQILKFKLNSRNKTYEVVFTTDSLDDAVTAINESVGFPVAFIGGGASEQLTITSPLKGAASSVEMQLGTPAGTQTYPGSIGAPSKVNAALGFGTNNQVTLNGDGTPGAGRPGPDLWLDAFGNVRLEAELLRSRLTGEPFSPGQADIYIQYRALRLDVSPLAAKPGLINVDTVTQLETILNPITSENPLALGMFFSLINSPGLVNVGMGVDDAPAGAPDGTLIAYSKVANFIESEEVYAIAPLSHDSQVGAMFKTHAEFMSTPEQKGERIVFHNPLVPVRYVDNVLASGLSGNTTATSNEFAFDVNPVSAVVDAGIDPGNVEVADDLFVELQVATAQGQEVRNYNVQSINGVIGILRTTFATGENQDAFYTTTPLTEALVNADWSLKVRGAKLLITGSTLPNKDAVAETVQKQNEAIKSRRFYSVFPDKVKATVGGTDELLEGFYACAAIAGMVAGQPPQQGFTNLAITGFTGVVGSHDSFSTSQMNVMAAGGTYILMQDSIGGPVICRHQLSTNLTSIETRELSITKVVDFTAKFLRTGLRNYIGAFNINQAFLDSLSTAINGMLKFLQESGVLLGADLNNVIQDETAPDTVLVDVTLDVPYPCNYIRLTLVV